MSIEISDFVGPLLGRAHDRLREQVEAALAGEGLHAREFGALVVLAAEGPISQRRLGAVQGVDRTTTVGILDALQARGLIERRRHPGDRRVYHVHLTAEGRRTLRRAGSEVLRAEERFMATLGPERDKLQQLLRRLVDQPSP